MSHEPVWLADVILFQVYDWKLKSWHSVECLLCAYTTLSHNNVPTFIVINKENDNINMEQSGI